MSLGKVSRFAAFAARESALVTEIMNSDAPAPEPTAHELRALRKAAKRNLRALADATPEQIDFAAVRTSSASKADNSLSELERDMRAALGLDKPTPPREAAPTKSGEIVGTFTIHRAPAVPKTQAAAEVAREQKLIREARAALNITSAEPEPEPVKRKIAKPTQYLKRKVEVILSIRNSYGAIVPFYYQHDGTSKLEAEIGANKKARGYGLTILGTRSIEVIEAMISAEACETKNKAKRGAASLSHA